MNSRETESPGATRGDDEVLAVVEESCSSVARTVQNVVITRSNKGNVELGERLRRLGFNPIAVDTISFLPPGDWSVVDEGLTHLHTYDWLVFTSVTGVEFFAQRMKKLSQCIAWKVKPGVAAVGGSTARALSKLGIEVNFIPSTYRAQILAAELPRSSGMKVLLLRADIADPLISERLGARGFLVTELPIYRTEHIGGGVEGRRLEHADLIVFASPSAVEGFCRMITNDELEKLRKISAACIGPATAAAAREHGFKRIVIPESQTIDSLLDGIARADHYA